MTPPKNAVIQARPDITTSMLGTANTSVVIALAFVRGLYDAGCFPWLAGCVVGIFDAVWSVRRANIVLVVRGS
jgi:hypothetical protein